MTSNSIILGALALALVFAFLSGCAKGNDNGENTGPVNGNGGNGSNAGTALTPEQKAELNDKINQIAGIGTELGALNNETGGFDESLDFEGGFGE